MTSRTDRIRELIADFREFRLCGPSDDPDMQDAVTVGYRHLLVQIQRLAAPILPEESRTHLESISVDIHSIYSVYEAHAELEALIFDIEEALDRAETTRTDPRLAASNTSAALRLVAIRVGDAIKYDTSINEIRRVASAVFDFPPDSHPHDSITSQRAQDVFDWIMTLANQILPDEKKFSLAYQFCTALSVDENRDAVKIILNDAGVRDHAAEDATKGPLAERGFHQEVVRHAGGLFEQGNFFHAVLEASKAYNQAVRRKSKSERDGQDLMLSAWSYEKGALRLGHEETATNRSVQDGIKFLSAGLMGAIRNPGAHEPAADWPIGHQDCLEILGFISFLFRKLETAETVGRKQVVPPGHSASSRGG